MFISCPECHQQYVFDIETWPLPTPFSDTESGWYLSCGRCNTEWWHPFLWKEASISEPLEEIPEEADKVANKEASNLYFVKTRIPKTEINSFHIYNSTPFQQTAEIKVPEAVIPFQRSLKPDLLSYNKGRSLQKKRPVWKTLLIGIFLGSLGGILYFYREPLWTLWEKRGLLKPPGSKTLILQPEEETLQEKNLPTVSKTLSQEGKPTIILQNVKYDLQPTEDGQKMLIIVGEVSNPNPFSVSTQPLHIVVRDRCSVNTSSSKKPPSLCPKAEWDHVWNNRTQILPGERVMFQTRSILPPKIDFDQIEVTLP